MDCSTFRNLVKTRSKNSVSKKILSKDLERHIQTCAICRNRYAPQSESDNDRVVPDAAKTKAVSPSADDLLDPFPDLSDPVEFKDDPLTFTLVLDSREEEIKIVEPEVDLPIPEGGRLVVREKETRKTDVIFTFNPESPRPYELHFVMKAGVSYAKPHVRKYGSSEINDKGFNDVYTESIVARGGVKAWIEMRRGTARIYIRYTS